MRLEPDRRAFFQGGAAVLGLAALDAWVVAGGAGSPPTPPTDLLALARSRMKAEVKPGVVLVVPADPAAAAKLADELARLVGGREPTAAAGSPDALLGKGFPPPAGPGDPAARPLFLQAAFVCLPRAQADRNFPRLPADAAVVLLSPAGEVVETVKAAPDLFGREFAPRMTRLLHGDKGERLADTARAQRAALGKDLAGQFDDAVRALDDPAFRAREAASGRLEELAPRATALMAQALRAEPSPEAKARLERVWDRLDAVTRGRPDPRLPYGVEWKTRAVDPCPGCGLGSVPHQARQFLTFLTEPPK